MQMPPKAQLSLHLSRVGATGYSLTAWAPGRYPGCFWSCQAFCAPCYSGVGNDMVWRVPGA